jgi:transcriptional regulator with XRE-family HTH domain
VADDERVDEQQVGGRVRAVRVQKGWRQEDVATAAGVSRSVVSRVEHGRFDEVGFEAVRRVCRALDMRFEYAVRWRGGDLERMVNARHAALHESAARLLAANAGWLAIPEVSFNVFGERGVIDVVAWRADRRALLVVELKTEFVDIQGLIGSVDRYRRLASRAVADRRWRPAFVSTWVFVAAGRANARALAAHRTVLRAAFPADGRRIAGWLQDPVERIDGLSFLPYVRGANVGRSLSTPHRVRARSAGKGNAARRADERDETVPGLRMPDRWGSWRA